jgi:CRP-like cAMP-binding protein
MVPFQELRRILLLENLSDSMLGRISPFIQLHVFSPGEIVFNQGEEAELFYMLKEGKLLLEVEASETINVSMGAIKAGYSFGWSALFSDSRYTSTAVATEPCEVMAIPGARFLHLMSNDHKMGHQVMEMIASILKRRLSRRTEQFLTAIKNHPDIQRLFEKG